MFLDPHPNPSQQNAVLLPQLEAIMPKAGLNLLHPNVASPE